MSKKEKELHEKYLKVDIAGVGDGRTFDFGHPYLTGCPACKNTDDKVDFLLECGYCDYNMYHHYGNDTFGNVDYILCSYPEKINR